MKGTLKTDLTCWIKTQKYTLKSGLKIEASHNPELEWWTIFLAPEDGGYVLTTTDKPQLV